MGDTNDSNAFESASNNVIVDFTVAKLRKLLSEYHDKGWLDAASQVEVALAAYESGKASVKWQNGLPYIKYFVEKQQ
jgi:predicted DNA-binding protein (UPF0278 family)